MFVAESQDEFTPQPLSYFSLVSALVFTNAFLKLYDKVRDCLRTVVTADCVGLGYAHKALFELLHLTDMIFKDWEK